MDGKKEMEEKNRSHDSLCQRVLNALLMCTGDMEHLDMHMQDRLIVMQLVVWCLRGVTRVILANNPLSGALILAAVLWTSPWQALLGTLGVLASTLTAVILGQNSSEISGGFHGFNGMLVSLLMGVCSSAGDWYWWLLLPACLGSATCVFLYSGFSSVLGRWDLPVSVFPFNTIIVFYLLCTGPDNPYFPNHPATSPGEMDANGSKLVAVEVISGIPLGVGQIFACASLGPSLLILLALLLYSPLLALHALLGSAVGTLAGLSMAVHHDWLYSGLSGLNGALGCMAVGGLFFIFSWRTHLFAIACAFLSAYADIALSNLLGSYLEARQLMKKSLTCNTSDLQTEEEEEEIRPKGKPKQIHFFWDTSDDSEGGGQLKKTARGPAKPSPSAPVIPPPPILPPTTLRREHRRPAEEQSPSECQVYRPTWRGGRRGSDTTACSGWSSSLQLGSYFGCYTDAVNDWQSRGLPHPNRPSDGT